MKFLNTLLNWIFPQKCVICSCEISEKAVFCINCFSKIVFIDQPLCRCCGKILTVSNIPEMLCEVCVNHPREFDICRSLFLYDDKSKKLIMRIKKQAASCVSGVCASMIFTRYFEIFKHADFIIPVPSHWTRVLKRGYNPSAIIAKELSNIFKIPMKTSVLKRTKKTEYQKNKTISERIKNVEGAFSCRIDLTNKTVLLVDDVFTTGATLNESAKTLKKAGAKKVFVITIAST